MNKKLTILFCLMVFVGTISAQPSQVDTLNVKYYENYPYAYMENGVLKGI